MTELRRGMIEELQLRNYSPTTITVYIRCAAQFAQHFRLSPDRLGPEHIRQYQPLVQQKEVSWAPRPFAGAVLNRSSASNRPSSVTSITGIKIRGPSVGPSQPQILSVPSILLLPFMRLNTSRGEHELARPFRAPASGAASPICERGAAMTYH